LITNEIYELEHVVKKKTLLNANEVNHQDQVIQAESIRCPIANEVNDLQEKVNRAARHEVNHLQQQIKRACFKHDNSANEAVHLQQVT